MADHLRARLAERNHRYQVELEDYFRREIVDRYPERAAARWRRDYSSVEAYERSITPNREHWRAVLNPPDLRITGPLQAEPAEGLEGIEAQFVRLPLDAPLRAEAILAAPEGAGPHPLVVCQHGIGSTPEHVMGLMDPDGAYHSFGRRLVESGFAVLAPFQLADNEPRSRIVRMATMLGTTLPGVELARLQRLLDGVLARPEIDEQRTGYWGLSLGGMAAQFFTPLEPRLRTAISAAWFNARLRKMVIPDPRYSCFLDTNGEHIWLRGWLAEFSDADQLSLICPRPVLVTTGKADSIAWWPQVVEEFEEARGHYERLGLADRIALDVHEGGHEIRWETGLAWLRKWLA